MWLLWAAVCPCLHLPSRDTLILTTDALSHLPAAVHTVCDIRATSEHDKLMIVLQHDRKGACAHFFLCVRGYTSCVIFMAYWSKDTQSCLCFYPQHGCAVRKPNLYACMQVCLSPTCVHLITVIHKNATAGEILSAALKYQSSQYPRGTRYRSV